jgi:DtxR family Mn-dependent transcriptional regulator
MYLKTIYTLEEKMGSAKTGDVAKILGITPGSVTNTLEVLETKGLVIREPYRGVRLTNSGRKIALLVFRRHRLAERLLTDALHFDWTDSHDEACKLEHSISEPLASSIEKALGGPRVCPHGNPIPDETGLVHPINGQPLSELRSGESATVSRIPYENTSLLRYLSSLGMTPGTKIKVEEVAPFRGPMLVKVGAISYPLSPDIAAGIYVNRSA